MHVKTIPEVVRLFCKPLLTFTLAEPRLNPQGMPSQGKNVRNTLFRERMCRRAYARKGGLMAKGVKARKITPWARRGIQIFFFVLVAVIATTEILAERGVVLPFVKGASLHAICPFGGVVSFWQMVTAGTLVKKVHESSVTLGVAALLLLILAGPVVCGWVCPLGSIQEWVGKIGRKIFGKKYNTFIPAKIDRPLRFLRYGVFLWVSYMTIVTGKLFFQEYDPYFALFQFWSGEVALSAFIILGATLVLSLFVERPFCKYACPFGAFQGLFNLVRIFGVKRRASTCINCKACDKVCPMNIVVSGSGTVRDHQCISCMECTSERACPIEDTVVLAAGALAEPAGGRAGGNPKQGAPAAGSAKKGGA